MNNLPFKCFAWSISAQCKIQAEVIVFFVQNFRNGILQLVDSCP